MKIIAHLHQFFLSTASSVCESIKVPERRNHSYNNGFCMNGKIK